jgi:hypothetical protein
MTDIFQPGFLQMAASAGPDSPPTPQEESRLEGAHELRKELDRHRLLLEVLVRALVDKGLFTREQLNAMANLVDMEDGVRDGKMMPKRGVRHCANCGRVMMNVSGACLYCGFQEVMDLI